jgi:fido (protein-threonine AMPylation protein)
MVTQYDVLEYLYKKGTPLTPLEVANAFKKSHASYHTIYNLMVKLSEHGFALKDKHGFTALRSKKNDLVYDIIAESMSNQINYNDLFDEKLAEFISKAFLKKRFTAKDFNIGIKKFTKNVEILSKYGLLIVLSRKPLTASIPYNSFLGKLVAYYDKKVHTAKLKDDEYLEEIDRELKRFRRLASQNLPKYQEISKEFEIRFVHHSLSIEGNPITLPDTIKILKEHIIPKDSDTESVQEVQNYQKAIKKMMQDAENLSPLNKALILNYHYLAMQHRPAIAGKIRTKPVNIRGNPDYDIAKVNDIEPRLDKLMGVYGEFAGKKRHSLKEILDFAAYFHNEFQHIHPFEDGNSRTTRLLAFHLLRIQNIPVFDIPLGLLEEYILSTKGSKKRDDHKLNQIIQRIIIYNLKTINERIS